MKTLLALLAAGTLVSSTPQVVEENLQSITFYSTKIISVNWNLEGGEKADLMVFYQVIGAEGNTLWLSKPFKYYQDINNDGQLQDREMFRFKNR